MSVHNHSSHHNHKNYDADHMNDKNHVTTQKHDIHSAHKTHEEHTMHHDHHAMMVADFRKRFWISLILTIPILLLSPMIQKFLGLAKTIQFPGEMYILFVLSSAVFFYGGYPFLKGLFKELKSAKPGMMTLIALAISVAYFYSSAVVFGLSGKFFFWELATLIDIMLLGHWVEMKSIMGASRALETLAKLMPSDAHKVMPGGEIRDVPLNALKPGDHVLIKPGEKIPADGSVIEGETSVNEAMLTGESRPVSKKSGDSVIGGAINGEGSITVEVKRTGKDSFLSQVIDLVKEAQKSRSKTQDLANRAAFWLTLIAIAGGILTLFIWLSIMNKDFAFALERTVTVMVITCPHALGLAVPLVIAVSTAISAANGLLIRNRVAFETARNIQAVIFDKTGTLTEGKFGVTNIIAFDSDIDEKQLLQYAASVEIHSEHPIARGIVESLDNAEKRLSASNFKAIPGKGARANLGKKEVMVVGPGYLRENNLSFESNKKIEELKSQAKTVVYVVVDGKVKGAIALADIIRPQSKEAISQFKQMGIRTMMLTGDTKESAKWVSKELDLDEYFAEVLPHEKSAMVKEVQSRGLVVAMTGDGVNDAPALAQADVGIAIGAGTDVAVETADIVLVRSNLMDVLTIIKLAKATYKKMVQNLAWATGYNAFAIPLAAGILYKYGILLSPAAGAVLMSLSTVIVAINARFLKIKK